MLAFSRGWPKGFFEGGPTVVKFQITNSKTRRRKTFFYQKVNRKISNFKIQRGRDRPFRRPSLLCFSLQRFIFDTCLLTAGTVTAVLNYIQASVEPATLFDISLKIADACRARGVIGYFAIDYVTFIDPITMEQAVWATDLSLSYR